MPKALAIELTLSAQIAAVAAKPAYAAALAKEAIDAAFIDGLKLKIAEANKLVASTGGATIDKSAST